MRTCLRIAGPAVRLSVALVCLFLLNAAAAQVAAAQNPTLKTRTNEERAERYASAHRITLNVQVSDPAGNPVSDLSAGDFTIYDNQQPRKIAAFHAIDGAAMYDATRVVILLDAVNSPAEMLEAERAGIFKYLAQSHRPFSYPTSFALWSNGHLTSTPATMDRDVVGRAFVSMTKGLHSNACTDDRHAQGRKVATVEDSGNADADRCRHVHFRDSIAALHGIAQQQMAGGGRTLLIWAGAGWPLFSDEEFQQLSLKEQREFAEEFVSLSHDLRAGQVTFYSVAASLETGQDTSDPAVNVAGNAPAPNFTADRLSLHELSRQTGGRVMAASKDVAADLNECVRDADWYYAVSFNSPPAQNGPGEPHSLEIKVNRPDLQVRTMTAYYPEP